ncbi:U6 snRNP-associated protein Lsm7 [Lithohypha guttulata]|uniref:U6 snRNP-associated protein Lsm7 n=1 Tax=Lithohypha guttulata TaxID=1690604 RepID=A0AAN7T9A1_9EURO|nr:U6 snRNP-associated protein Lsm7 [Lithohypha guttulata]KAK5091296.1 U6 snRNP-associated protein Lsm7 [Lithohypha guttulata]KAK5100313.1 U6 snRNP-associated protein Lsm7 [Lithohypha guttulata]
MSERGHFRGGGGRGQSRGSRGYDRGGRGGNAQSGREQQEKPKKENILDLTKYMHKQVQVKFNGGREDDEGNETTRDLGLIVARGTLLVLISPMDGSEEIENPFAQPAED